MEEQVIKLCDEDKSLLKKLLKWIRFFSLMYVTLWIIMCAILFTIMWIFVSSR